MTITLNPNEKALLLRALDLGQANPAFGCRSIVCTSCPRCFSDRQTVDEIREQLEAAL